MLLHPRPILINIGGIDHEEEVIVAHLIDKQIIDSAPILIAHHTIIYLTHRSARYVVGKDVLHIAFSILTLHGYFTHVTDVKESYLLTHSHVFWRNTCILNRHDETTKGRHQCS